MPNLVLFVAPGLERCRDVLDAWERCGVSGVTILESIGLHKIRELVRRDDLPLFPSLRHLLEEEEYHHRTIFTVVGDDFELEALIEATRRAVGGDFDAPNSGLLVIVPVARAFGLRPHWKGRSEG
ncbi:MAG: hypothetical protein ACP5OO_03440 [Chloroflexia bacterium]